MYKNCIGIICEYDPFHLGHAHQFAMIRNQYPDAAIVCVMSGCFTQRGMPALFSPAFRAKAALDAGASVVLELPVAFSVRDAENFALGGVSILNQLSFISHISFGVEDVRLNLLRQTANLLENPSERFVSALQQSLAKGVSYATAQANAVLAVTGQTAIEPIIAKPNNILAVCYLRALMRLQSTIEPLPIQREGNYHSDSLSPAVWPSASAIRKAYFNQNLAEAEAACGYSMQNTAVHLPDALDVLLLNVIRSTPIGTLRDLPDCTEGLENRLRKFAHTATNRETLLSSLKTKRYTYTRLNRLLAHALLGFHAPTLHANATPTYVRLLGFRREYQSLLSLFRDSQIPVIGKASQFDKTNPLYQLDERAYDLWALGAGVPSGLLYQQQVVIV